MGLMDFSEKEKKKLAEMGINDVKNFSDLMHKGINDLLKNKKTDNLIIQKNKQEVENKFEEIKKEINKNLEEKNPLIKYEFFIAKRNELKKSQIDIKTKIKENGIDYLKLKGFLIPEIDIEQLQLQINYKCTDDLIIYLDNVIEIVKSEIEKNKYLLEMENNNNANILNMENTKNSTPLPTQLKKLKWNGQKNILIDIFYQLKKLNNDKSQPLLPNSNEDIALFLKNSFECFDDTEISTIVGVLKKSERPKKSEKRIIIDCLEKN